MSNIPVLDVSAVSMPEAWEKSVVRLYDQGLRYNRGGPKDTGREQVDSTMTMTVRNPDSKHFLHKMVMFSTRDLLEYQMEILGAKDSLVVSENDELGDTRWDYHYHERMEDQIEYAINKLVNEPHMRRANMITWVPEKDCVSDAPPCLQRVWLGLVPNEEGYSLNMNYHFRSRNVMIAAPENMVGLYTLQCFVRDEINKRADFDVRNGRLVDIVDSYHVSANDMEMFENWIQSLERKKEEGSKLKDRAYSRKVAFDILSEDLDTIEGKIIEQVRNRWEERKGLPKNLGMSGLFDRKLEEDIEKVREISDYMRGFLENVEAN